MRQVSIKIDSLIIFMIMLFTILISGTAVYSVEQFARLRDITLIFLFFTLLYFFIKKTRKLNQKDLLITSGAVIFYCGSVIIHPSASVGNFFSKVLMFILYYFMFSISKNREVFLLLFYRSVIFLAALALSFFIGLYLIRLPIPHFSMSNGLYNSYCYLFFNSENYRKAIGSFAFYRLQGVFWEPGVFAIYLILALYYYIYMAKNQNPKVLYLLLACLALTLSTTGIILGLLMIGVLFLKKYKNKNIRFLIIVPLGMTLCIAIYYVWTIKKEGVGSNSASYNIRLHDLKSSLSIWKSHLLFGTGYGNSSEFSMAKRKLHEDGNSNGFLNWCMTMGVWGLIVQILPLMLNIINSKKKARIPYVVLALVYVGINMSEPLITSPLMIMLLAFMYSILTSGNERILRNEVKWEKNSAYLSEVLRI